MPVLFSTDSYTYLRDTILDQDLWYPRCEKGLIRTKRFPDEEMYQCIDTSVRDRDVILIGGTITHAGGRDDVIEIFDAACAIAAYGARSLSIVIPYFGYSTMERAKPMSREVVKAKTRARILSAIPDAYLGNRVFLFDLHAEGIPHYFGDNTHQIHVRGDDIVVSAAGDIISSLENKYDSAGVVLGSTDAGGAKKVEHLATQIGCEIAALLKRRNNGSSTTVTNVNADVDGKHVIIYDDMTRSGSSLVNAAVAYKERGAISVSAVLSHGVYTKTPAETLELCGGHLEYVYSTDSHPRAVAMQRGVRALGSDVFRVRTCGPALMEAVFHHLPRGWGRI